MTNPSPELTRADAEVLYRLSKTQGRAAAATQFPRFRVLDKSAAEVFFKDSEILDWSCITELSADAAALCFARFGLTEEVDGKDATSLLRFDGLENVDVATAGVLGGYTLGPLSLNGLRSLSSDAARELSRLRFGQLKLNGITVIEPMAFAWLYRTYDGVELDSLQTLGNEHLTANPPSGSGGGSGGGPFWQISLKSITYLPQAWADRFGREGEACREEADDYACDHWIDLSGLRVLNSALLATEAALTHHGAEGACVSIQLDKIETITLEAATALVTALGGDSIRLPSLTEVTPDMACLFCKQCTHIELDGVATMSDETAAEFSHFEGELLSLNALTQLSDAGMGHLAASAATTVALNGLKTLSKSKAESIARGNCRAFELDGLEQVSDEVTRILSEATCQISCERLRDEWESQREITCQQAEVLVSRKSRLNLCGLRSVPEDVASVLARYSGECLNLSGLSHLDQWVAEILGSSKAERLELDGLTELSGPVAKGLVAFNGFLSLNGISTLSRLALEQLMRFEGIGMSLTGIRSATTEELRGLLTIDGLELQRRWRVVE
jgi:hypothetical protein